MDFNGKTLRKVYDYLKEKDSPVSITQISNDLGVHFYTVKAVINQLKEFDKIILVTNGNITLVQVRGEEDGSYGYFDARLLRAAYNFQASKKEPHGFIHNSKYIAQLLVDSIGHIEGDTSAYKWRK